MSHPSPGQPAYPPSAYPARAGADGGKPRLRGRIPLRLAIGFLVVAVALLVVGGVVVAKKSLGAVDGFSRVSVAARTGTVDFTGTGRYVAYYEAPGVDDDTRIIPVVQVRLTAPSGTSMVLDTFYGGDQPTDGSGSGRLKSLKYQHNGHDGAALYQFDITEAGTYQVTLLAGANVAANADMAFGRSIIAGTVTGLLTILGGVLLLIVGVVLLVVGLVKRTRHKNQLMPAYGGGYPTGPPYGPPGLATYPQPGGWQPPQAGGWQPPGPTPQQGWQPPGPASQSGWQPPRPRPAQTPPPEDEQH